MDEPILPAYLEPIRLMKSINILHELSMEKIEDYARGELRRKWEPRDSANPRSQIVTALILSEETAKLKAFECHARLLSLFSVFEASLMELSREVLRTRNFPLSDKDFSGSGLERAKLILSKVGGLAFLFSKNEWRTILNIQVVRNLIAHTGGLVSSDSSQAEKLNGIEGVSFVAWGTGDSAKLIYIAPAFMEASNKALFDFLLLVAVHVEGKITC